MAGRDCAHRTSQNQPNKRQRQHDVEHDAKSLVHKKGRLFVGAMNLRGTWSDLPPGAKRLNVTSAQGKANPDRAAFSPMTERATVGPDGETYFNLESAWQSGKVFNGVDPKRVRSFWRTNKAAKRRYPGSKGREVLHASWDDGKTKLGYIESRKTAYVPMYERHLAHPDSHARLEHWERELESGKDVAVYDFDGPRSDAGVPLCLEVTPQLLEDKLNDTRHPFGHGYVVAAALIGHRLGGE